MSYSKFLRWGVIVGICLVPFVAFIVASGGLIPNMFFPFISGKNFVFRILVELLVLLYIILAVREPKYRPKASLLMWAVCAFTLWMALATALSVDPIKSFWSNFERMDGYITVLHLFVLFIVSGAVLSAEKLWEKFFQVSVSASVLMGLYGVLQLMGVLTISSQSGPRVDTTFGNATYLAVFMLFNIFIALFMLTREWKLVGMRYFYGIALVLQIITLYFTETRGAELGLVGGLIIAALYITWRAKGGEWRTLRKFSWISLAAIVVIVALFFVVRSNPTVQALPGMSRLTSISFSDATVQARLLYIWPMAYQGFLERPVTGWGQENFNFVFNEHYNPAMYAQEQWFDRAHNEFLDWLIAGGAPAFLLYLSLFVLAAWAIVKSEALNIPEQGILLGLLGAYAFNNLFVFDNLMSIVYFFLLLAFLHGLSWRQLPRLMWWLKPASDQTVAVIAPIIAVLVLGGAWMLNADGIARAQTIIAGLQTTSATTGAPITPDQNFAAFELAMTQGELGKQETVEQLLQFASNTIAPSTSVSPDLKQQVYTYTHTAGIAMLAERPNDSRLELFMAIFLAQFGQYDEALSHLQNAVVHSPQKQQILFQEGQVYLQKGDAADALPLFKKAYDLAPDYDQAVVYYASALYYAGQTSAGDALLTQKFGTVLADNDQLLQAYMNTKQYARAISIWQARIAKSPKDTNLVLGLASVYFFSGDNADAIAQLKKVSTIDPSQAAQMQSIITQIQNGTLKPQ